MDGLSIDFLGHSALTIELDGVRLLTDPALRGRIGPLRRTSPEPGPDAVAAIDAVLVSHLHWDHLDLPSLRRVGPAARIVVPEGAGDWLRRQGFQDVVELRAGTSVEIGATVVEAVPARHGGTRPPLGPVAGAVGYVVRGRHSVWFAGDTALFPEMRDLEGIDVALIPVGGWGPTLRHSEHLDAGDAARALELVGAPVAVPIHWGTYWPAGMHRLRRERLFHPPVELRSVASELAPATLVLPTEAGERVSLP